MHKLQQVEWLSVSLAMCKSFQAALARLEALENDNPGAEMVEINSDEDASLDDEDQGPFNELFFVSS